MFLIVCGPNLRVPDYEFHVHAEGCKDLGKYGPGKPYGGEEGFRIEAENESDVAREIYADIINEGQTVEQCLANIKFAPCVKGGLK